MTSPRARAGTLLKKLEGTSLFQAELGASVPRIARAERSVGGSTTFSWLQFWVMRAGTRNGDYRDGSPPRRITWYFLILAATADVRRSG